MSRRRAPFFLIATAALCLTASACRVGPSARGSFDKTYSVSGPLRLELTNSSGAVEISGGSPGEVTIHADVSISSFGFGGENPERRLQEILAQPPIEQRAGILRVGNSLSHINRVSIAYRIEVPAETEISITAASGEQTIRSVRGPLKITVASGAVHVSQVEREIQINSMSGAVDVRDAGDDVRANTASGEINVDGAKGDVRASTMSGSVEIARPGNRIDAGSMSGTITVHGAQSDVKAKTVSGGLNVQGNPASNTFWSLASTSGSINISAPSSSNFQFSAESRSGGIHADIPIVIEQQDRHSLRARVGNGGGRLEMHTTSGSIRIQPGG